MWRLIWVYTVCSGLSVAIFRVITVTVNRWDSEEINGTSNSEHSSKRVANDVSSTAENMIKEK